MPPNANAIQGDAEDQFQNGKSSTDDLIKRSDEDYRLRIFHSSLNILTHVLIGAVTGISIFYAFRNGIPLGATPLHIVLCVIGYQLLMAEAILSLSPYNGWSANLRLVDKRRAHWILQILGSGLALGGCIYKVLDKDVHWNTLHGQFALVAMIFTVFCFFNGVASSYSYEWRRIIPPNVSKLTHICFGTVAFAAASISLCYGFDKVMFRNWVTPGLTPTVIAFTAAFTAIVILNPLIVFGTKSLSIFKR